MGDAPKPVHIVVAILVLVSIGLLIGLVVCLTSQSSPQNCNSDESKNEINELKKEINELKKEINESKKEPNESKENNPLYEEYQSAAVATGAGPCSKIGKNLLQKGGSVVDAAIGAMLCVGIYNCHSTGIGGGSIMSIYNASTGEAIYINSREVAPLAATRHMFVTNYNLSDNGSLAIAVPGEIAGYWEAHKRFGKLEWKELFEPSIKLAEDGIIVNKALGRAIKIKKSGIEMRKYNLEPIFTNANGSLKAAGDKVTRTTLASTLRLIASEGGYTFYNGTLSDLIIKDLEDAAGGPSKITKKDLKSYRVEVKPLINITIGDLTLFTPGLPGGGPVLCYILNILKGYNFTKESLGKTDAKIQTYHRILEAFKFAYAKRARLGDEKFDGVGSIKALVQKLLSKKFADETRLKINDTTTYPSEYYEPDIVLQPGDSGTAHLSIVGEDGSAVSMTSTINKYFGSLVRGLRTGIIFNNQMNDFSWPNKNKSEDIPPSPTNYIAPGKHPLSSLSPTIIVDTTDSASTAVKKVVGASGGLKIMTATALAIMNNLWFGMRIDESVSMARLHHGHLPNTAMFEYQFPKDIVEGLKKKGHSAGNYSRFNSVIQAIERFHDGRLGAKCDERKAGYPKGY